MKGLISNSLWRDLARLVLGFALAAAISLLVTSWYKQTSAPPSCTVEINPRANNSVSGYLQISVLKPNTTEEYFEGNVFLNYFRDSRAPASVQIVRGGQGIYGPEVISAELVPFGGDLAMQGALTLSLPTPGVSQRRFPFDSPAFDLDFAISPPISPSMVIVRNVSSGFLTDCVDISASWNEQNHLQVKAKFQRNPFVQLAVVFMALAAITFAVLLYFVRGTDELATATGAYFFSIWSVRTVVVPDGLPYSSYFDMVLMFASLIALFVVLWRVTELRESTDAQPKQPNTRKRKR